jgi:hypothetical protein
VGSLAGSAYLRDRDEVGGERNEDDDRREMERERRASVAVSISGSGVLGGAAVRRLGMNGIDGVNGINGINGYGHHHGGRGERYLLGEIHARLPDWDEGRAMAEAYWDHVNWM